MSLSSREFRLALRFLVVGYILGYFGVINSMYMVATYIVYKLVGFDLGKFILRSFIFSGEAGAVLFNRMAEFRESPRRVSAENLKSFIETMQGIEVYPKIVETENRLVDWLGQMQHRRVGEFFGVDMTSSPTPSPPTSPFAVSMGSRFTFSATK